MKRERRLQKTLLILTFILSIALCIAVVLLMRHVQTLLNSDVKINLTEIVSQNKDVITSKLMLEMNNMNSMAGQLSKELVASDGTAELTRENEQRVLVDLLNTYPAFGKQLSIADRNGLATFADGEQIDIAGRKYFRLSNSGIQNISDRVVSRKDGKDVFIVSVPIYHNNEIVGTLQRSYPHDVLYELCKVSLFSSQGYMHIINSDGYVLLHTEHANCYMSSDNYFRDIFEDGNREVSQQMQRDISSNQAGFAELLLRGDQIFSAYTPIESIHDWYLITSVPNSAVSPNGNIVVVIFYCTLLFVVLIFFLCTLYFIWYKKKQRIALEAIAFVDSVTDGKTYNRFELDVRSALAEHPEQSFYLLKFDIDNFKYINSYYGFGFGDKILKQIYQEVAGRLTEPETLARISGDHFVALLQNADEDRLRDLLSFVFSLERITVYVSAGVYTIPKGEENVSLMLDKAGTAARSVKGVLNRQIGYYSESFDQETMENEQLKRKVNLALLNDEFEPFYQPKVHIDTGEVVGAEALVRWRTADNKLIPPGVFIPMCEKTGLVVDIDLLILEKVLRFLQRQMEEQIECIPISVNLSRLHLLDEDFMNKIIGLVERYHVPSGLIELELTESAILENMDSIFAFITSLQALGFSISMDDFGSGYSSLHMLKDIPIDVLKIDKGFLSETQNNDRRDIIFSAVAQMAKSLDIKVVVEGVEYQENVELMRACGCRIAQGYFFARPMEEQAFEKIFKERVIC